jgi:hypothetical protein
MNSTLSSSFQIFPSACNCPGSAAAWGCILQTFQNVLTFAVFLAVVALTIFIAMAGFDYMTSGGSAEKRSAANKRIINVVLGLFITLAAYLLIDSLMKVIYDPSTAKFGPWNSILASSGTASDCLAVQPTPSSLPGLLAPSNGAGGSGQGVAASSGTGSGTQNNNGQCTASNLSSTFGNNAAAMSCVTKYEDTSCNPSEPSGVDIGADGKPVSFGLFQVNISATNLSQYPACETAVGGQTLNCTQAFSGGVYTASNHSTRVSNPNLYSTCVTAASNPSCNEAAAAAKLNQSNPPSLTPWGTAARNNCSSLLQ